MRRIGVITDAHANLPALEAALAAIDAAGCEEIVHMGDAIAIGPWPAECLEVLLDRDDVTLLMGNHDEWFASGLPEPQPAWMSDGERAHQEWTHVQIDPRLRGIVATWPYELQVPLGARVARFCHYARRADGADFASIVTEPTVADLDRLFGGDGGVVFYGHHHPRSDLQGAARYVNPGALGCHTEAETRFAILTIGDDGAWEVDLRAVPYDRERLVRAYRERGVPAAGSLLRMFHGAGE